MANHILYHVVTNSNGGWDIKKGIAERDSKYLDAELSFRKESNVIDSFSF
jgi:hypothetical protein